MANSITRAAIEFIMSQVDGLTVPQQKGIASLIEERLEVADVKESDIRYFFDSVTNP